MTRGLLIFGSPHPDGKTAKMADRLMQATPVPVDWSVWRAFERPALACDDCGFCRVRNGCSKPDLTEFYERLENADLLAIATPVYNLSYTAPVKILMDRTQRYWAARFVRGERPPIARPKRAMLLTCADQDRHAGEMVERQLRPTLTVLNAALIASIHSITSDPWTDVERRIVDAAEKWIE